MTRLLVALALCNRSQAQAAERRSRRRAKQSDSTGSATCKALRRFPSSTALATARLLHESVQARVATRPAGAEAGRPRPNGCRCSCRTVEAGRRGGVDIECGTTSWTFTRQQVVDFSLMTFVDGACLLVGGNSGIRRIADRRQEDRHHRGHDDCRARCGATQGVQAERESREGGHARGGLRQADGRRCRCLRLRSRGPERTPAGIDDGPLRLIDEDFSVEPYTLAMPRGDPAFRLEVDRALAKCTAPAKSKPRSTGGSDPSDGPARCSPR